MSDVCSTDLLKRHLSECLLKKNKKKNRLPSKISLIISGENFHKIIKKIIVTYCHSNVYLCVCSHRGIGSILTITELRFLDMFHPHY